MHESPPCQHPFNLKYWRHGNSTGPDPVDKRFLFRRSDLIDIPHAPSRQGFYDRQEIEVLPPLFIAPSVYNAWKKKVVECLKSLSHPEPLKERIRKGVEKAVMDLRQKISQTRSRTF
jgi:hypothetical protein